METQALRLLFDKSGPVPKAVGIEILREGRKHIIRAKKEIISSAGAINSPQLLMVSGERDLYSLYYFEYVSNVKATLELSAYWKQTNYV